MAYESYFEDRLKWIEKRLNFANGTKRCLDVGCGAGCFTSVFQKAGWDAYGLESIQHYAEFARTRYGIKVINGFIEDAQLPESYFDMVTLHSVLEHLRNPIQALLRIRNLVKPQGYIYIRVPNVLKPESLPYFEAPHLYMFSPKTLSLALRKTGFQAAYLESGYKVHALAQKGNLPVNIDYATEGDDYRKVVKVVKLNNMRLFLKQRVRPKLRFIAVRTLGQSNEQRIIHLIRRVVH